MMNIQDQLAKKICSELNLDEEQYEIIRYGAFAIMQISLCIIAVAVFGLLFGVMLQALIVSFSTSILRQYSGGAHASRPGSCAVIGTAVSIGLALFIKYIGNFMNVNTMLIVESITFLSAFYIINKYAPVDSKAKPIKSEAKRKKMRKRSFLIATSYLVLSIVFFFIVSVYKECKFLHIYFRYIWRNVISNFFSYNNWTKCFGKNRSRLDSYYV